MADSLSQIAIEKLDKNNFQVWKFRIMNFLMGKGYWEFITGDETECRAPKFLVDPLEGPSMRQCGRSWNLKHDPDFQH
jgi:hypothetical protein